MYSADVLYEVAERPLVQTCEVGEIDSIDAPLAKLTFAHEGLRRPESRCDLHLRQSRREPSLSQAPQHVPVAIAVYGTRAGGRASHPLCCTLFQNTPVWDIVCIQGADRGRR